MNKLENEVKSKAPQIHDLIKRLADSYPKFSRCINKRIYDTDESELVILKRDGITKRSTVLEASLKSTFWSDFDNWDAWDAWDNY